MTSSIFDKRHHHLRDFYLSWLTHTHFRILGHLIPYPGYIFWHVSVHTWQFWVSTHYTPTHYSTDKPFLLVLFVLAQQRTSRIALLNILIEEERISMNWEKLRYWKNLLKRVFTWHASFPPSGYPAHIIPSVTFISLYAIQKLQTFLFKTGTWTSFTANSYSEAVQIDLVRMITIDYDLNIFRYVLSVSFFLPQPITVHNVPGINWVLAVGRQTGLRCSWNCTRFSSWK